MGDEKKWVSCGPCGGTGWTRSNKGDLVTCRVCNGTLGTYVTKRK